MPRTEHAPAGYFLLIVTIIFGWWGFAHELHLVDIQYSDVAFHLSVLRALDSAVKSGQNPLDFWYDTVPYGFALFRSYQYLPYLFMYGFYRLMGEYYSLSVVLIGSTALLASTALPVSVFFSMRLIGARQLECGIAAVLSVLISDGSEYGMGLQNYTFGTVGIVTQLWAMVFLFPAIAATFRYLNTGRNLGSALLFSFLTFGSHVVAAVIIAVCAAVFSAGAVIRDRRSIRRPCIFLGLFLLVTAHQWMFILSDSPFINRSLLEPSWKYDGRGVAYLAHLFWNGELFDCSRFPILTLFLLLAFTHSCVYLKRAKAEPGGEFYSYAPFLLLLFLSLCAGRQIWGSVFNLLPVLQSLHVHRFLIGAHLFGIVIVAYWLGMLARSFARSQAKELLFSLLFLGLLYPAVAERARMFVDTHKRQTDTAARMAGDTGLREMLDALVKLPYGWTYIGSKSSWQSQLLVAGYIPLDLMTSTRGIPTVGGILYHAFSLAGETLFDFDPNNPAHFELFGIRNVVSPAAWAGSPGFTRVGVYGRYALWTRDSRMLFVADERFKSGDDFVPRTEIVRSFVQQFAMRPEAGGSLERQSMEHPWRIEGTVAMQTAGTVIAAEGYHPGWTATVDGTSVKTRRVNPGLIAIDVPAGKHVISFQYHGSSFKLLLLFLSAGVIAGAYFRSARNAPATPEG